MSPTSYQTAPPRGEVTSLHAATPRHRASKAAIRCRSELYLHFAETDEAFAAVPLAKEAERSRRVRASGPTAGAEGAMPGLPPAEGPEEAPRPRREQP